MSLYTPVISDIPTGLDEVGYRVGLPRLTHESSASYRLRLLAFVRNRPRPDETWYFGSVSNLLGLISLNLLDIDLALDGDGLPVAEDPRIEITATRLRLWNNYQNNELDKDLDLLDEYKTLGDLKAEIDTSTYFTCSALDAEHQRKLSRNLRVGNSDGWKSKELLTGRKVHKFGHPYIVSIWPDITGVFVEPVASIAAVNDYGKYYLDDVAGVVHTYQPAGGFIKYQYRDFPFRVWWDPVRAVSMVDQDIRQLTREVTRGESGGDTYEGGLTTLGASVYQELLSVHPLEWGQ